MIRSKWLEGKDGFEEAKEILKECSPVNIDEKDILESLFLIIYDETDAVACGSMKISDNMAVISHIAVKKDHQKKDLGDLVMKTLMYRAVGEAANKFVLYSPLATIVFFERYGFKVTKKDKDGAYMEVYAEDCLYPQKCCR